MTELMLLSSISNHFHIPVSSELYKGLIEHIGDHLSPDQISMIINALDTNDDKRIDLAELSTALEEE